MSKKLVLPVLVILLAGISCAPQQKNESTSTVTALVVTTTASATATFTPSSTPPPPLQPTVVPITGITSTQLNVRAEPSTASNVLGVIPANTNLEILGKDLAGNWLQIIYPSASNGVGWVTAQYIVIANGSKVPVIGGGGNPNDGPVAIVQQQLNVRSGPGTDFNSVGTLNPQDVVSLTGKNAAGVWLQIQFSAGPDGKGWVSAAFVQAQGVERVPIITDAGEAIGTSTPTGIPPTLTPTVVPAWLDNDSQAHPIASVALKALGTRALIYSGDVSSPNGDKEDWIQFTSDNSRVFATLDCPGRNNLQVSLLENGQPAAWELVCGEVAKELTVQAGSVYLLYVAAPQATDGLQYISYAITIQTSP